MDASVTRGEYVGGPLDGERAAVPPGGVGPAGSRLVVVWLRGPSATYVADDDGSGLRWRYLSSVDAA
jgi:hypothetical protein